MKQAPREGLPLCLRGRDIPQEVVGRLLRERGRDGRHRRQRRRMPQGRRGRGGLHGVGRVLARVPKSKRPRVAAMLKAIHAMESREASEAKAIAVATELDGMRLREAARVVRNGCAETLTTRGSPASTGGAYAPTTPSSGLTARSAGAPEWWAPSRTEGAPSCS